MQGHHFKQDIDDAISEKNKQQVQGIFFGRMLRFIQNKKHSNKANHNSQPAQKRYRFIKNPIGARYGNHQGNPLCDVRFDNSGMANGKAKQNKDNRQQNGKGEIVYVERYSAGLDLRPEKNPCGGYGTQIIHRNQKNIYGSSGFDELK